jgi:hypothetical protein
LGLEHQTASSSEPWTNRLTGRDRPDFLRIIFGRDALLRVPNIWADRQVSPTVFDLW